MKRSPERRLVAASRALLVCIVAVGSAAACDRIRSPGNNAQWVELDPTHMVDAPVVTPGDTVWGTIAKQESFSRSTVPVPFHTTSTVLRVITRLGELEPGYVPGLVVTNILSESGSVPLAIVRAEQNRGGVVTVDTTRVEVDPGELLFYINTAHGVTNWAVTVQAPARIGPSSLAKGRTPAEISLRAPRE